MFHGYYEQYQYLPIVVTCAENDMVLLVGLRHGTCHASLGADNDLRYLTGRIAGRLARRARSTSGGTAAWACPVMYDVCQELRLTYTFGIGMNSRLCSGERRPAETGRRSSTSRRGRAPAAVPVGGLSGGQLAGVAAGRHQGRSALPRGPTDGPWSPTGPAVGSSRRAVYDEYAMRGESENRNKELKVELHAGRLSDHRFLANFFRLYLHAAALNLLVRLRRATTKSPTPVELGIHDPLPAAALPETSKKRFFNRRRRRDPLGEGQPCTWRTRLIKVAVEVLVSSRRVLVKLASSWPHRDELFRLGDQVSLLGSS